MTTRDTLLIAHGSLHPALRRELAARGLTCAKVGAGRTPIAAIRSASSAPTPGSTKACAIR
jgi:hypothetical protein